MLSKTVWTEPGPLHVASNCKTRAASVNTCTARLRSAKPPCSAAQARLGIDEGRSENSTSSFSPNLPSSTSAVYIVSSRVASAAAAQRFNRAIVAWLTSEPSGMFSESLNSFPASLADALTNRSSTTCSTCDTHVETLVEPTHRLRQPRKYILYQRNLMLVGLKCSTNVRFNFENRITVS